MVVKLQYVIYNDSKKSYLYYDGSGRSSATTDEKRAEKFDHFKANNIINNMISKKDRHSWKIVECREKSETNCKSKASKKVASNDIEQVKQLDSITYSKEYWLKIAKEIKDFSIIANQRSAELSLKLSEIDKNIEVNLKHEIEFGKFSASNGYKKLIEFQKMLLERRKIKNELFSLNLILNSNIKTQSDGNIVKGIKGLDSRRFQTRT